MKKYTFSAVLILAAFSTSSAFAGAIKTNPLNSTLRQKAHNATEGNGPACMTCDCHGKDSCTSGIGNACQWTNCGCISSSESCAN